MRVRRDRQPDPEWGIQVGKGREGEKVAHARATRGASRASFRARVRQRAQNRCARVPTGNAARGAQQRARAANKRNAYRSANECVCARARARNARALNAQRAYKVTNKRVRQPNAT